MTKEIKLSFDGYWRKPISGSNGNFSGIYCVYTGKSSENGKCSLNKLIYIGESENVSERLIDHERKDDWKRKLESEEILYFSIAPIAGYNRDQAEAALIFKHKPVCNTEYVKEFHFEDTTMIVSGETRELSTSFTVRKS